MAAELWKCQDPSTWAERAAQYADVARRITARFEKGGFVSINSELRLQAIVDDLKTREPPELTREELIVVRDWKMSRNEWRPNWKLIEDARNSDATVRSATREAFALARSGEWAKALKHADMQLFGVGPATASIMLSMLDPQHPVFGEEAITASGMRGEKESHTYTHASYKRFHETMHERAQELNALAARASKGAQELTPVDLERALFVAERAPKAKGKMARSTGDRKPAASKRVRVS